MKILSEQERQAQWRKKIAEIRRYMRLNPDDPGPWTLELVVKSEKKPKKDRVALETETIIVRRLSS